MITILPKQRYIVLSLLWAMIIVAADQGSKFWAIKAVLSAHVYNPITVTDFLNIVLTFNTGVTFGFMADSGFGVLPLVLLAGVIVGYVVWLWWSHSSLIDGIMLMAIVGGALGNIIDRLRVGAVIDFIDVHYMGYHWPAFNVADSAIVLGVLVYIVRQWRTP